MTERALLSPDELKSLPKGEFVVMKTGTYPMRTKLQLYFKWGIKFEEPYQTPERAQREVYYAGKEELLMNIKRKSLTQTRPPIAPKADDYKLTLTIKEAAEYSNIGINKIDALLKQPNCPFVLFVGTRKLVKRREFEEYIRRELII